MKRRLHQPLLHEVSCPLCGQFVNQHTYQLYPPSIPTNVLSTHVFSARRLPDRIHYQYLQCPHDTLVFASPVFAEKEINTLYQLSRFTYERETTLLTKTYLFSIEHILKQLSKKAVIVEVGSGNGFLLQEIQKKGFINVYGIEPSKEATQKADVHIKKRLINSIFHKKLFTSSSVDFIFLFQTFDHLYDPNQFLETCYTMLKPGGYLFSLHHDVGTWQRKVLGTRHPIIDIEHPALYSKRTTTAMFQKHGFLVHSIVSPSSFISLSHLLWLLPLPRIVKKFLSSKEILRSVVFKLKLGNIAITSQKPTIQ